MDYYSEIKNKLLNNEIYSRVKDYSKERYRVSTYFEVGKLLIEAQGGESRAKYGDNLIKEYSRKLTMELGKGYNVTSLKRMRQFYIIVEKGAALRHQLTWSHYRELLSLDDIGEINYYIEITINQNLSYRLLHDKIKNNEYERLSYEIKSKLKLENRNINIKDFIKNPIIIKNKYNCEEISEKILQRLIIEDIDKFLNELGRNFCYVGNQYRIKLDDRYNYIDLLLYNIEFNCYVAVELKVTELKKEHIGQIQVYMNYIDKNVKSINQDKTIGIIICRKDNKFIMEYCSDPRVYRTTYELVY